MVMDSNKIDVILITEDIGRVRQFRVSAFLIPLVILFLFSSGVYSGWIGRGYQEGKAWMHHLVQLKKTNALKREELLSLAQRIHQINQKIEDFKEINQGLKALINRKPSGVDIDFLSLGESDPVPLEPDHLMNVNQPGLVRLIHEGVEALDDNLDSQKREMFGLAEFIRKGKTLHISKFIDPYVWAKEGTLDLPSQKSERRMKILQYLRRERLGIHEAAFTEGGGLFAGEADSGSMGKNLNKLRMLKDIKSIAIDLGVEPILALAMAKVESGYDHRKVSPKGAIGVLQVMPRLAKHDFGISREMLFEPQVNILVGLSWMKYLLKRFDQNLDLSLAAYNAGVTRVLQAGYKIPSIKETQNYVRKVKEVMKNDVLWTIETI